MNYEEKYKEALEFIKSIYPTTSGNIKEDIEHYFPELKESEDEKIRKELIEQVVYMVPNNNETDNEGNVLPSYQKRIDKYIAWLEKQKECKWSEEDEKIRKWIIHFIEVRLPESGEFEHEYHCYCLA